MLAAGQGQGQNVISQAGQAIQSAIQLPTVGAPLPDVALQLPVVGTPLPSLGQVLQGAAQLPAVGAPLPGFTQVLQSARQLPAAGTTQSGVTQLLGTVVPALARSPPPVTPANEGETGLFVHACIKLSSMNILVECYARNAHDGSWQASS